MLKEIVRVTEPMRTRINIEPSLSDLLSGYNTYLTGDELNKIYGDGFIKY